MTDEERKRYRCRLLDADFEEQERLAAREAGEATPELDPEDDYDPINRF